MQRIRWFHLGMTAVCMCFVLTVQAHAQLHDADFRSSDEGYTVTNVGNIQNEWTWASGEGWQVNGNEGGDGSANNLSKLTSPPITIMDTGSIELSFDHRYTIEADWDAGAVFTSVNGSAFQQVPGTSFTKNGYTKQGLLGQHFLNGGEGFNGDTPNFRAGALITSIADLGVHNTGDDLQIQFVGAWDQFATGALTPPEWQIVTVAANPQRTDPFLPVDLPGPSGGTGFWGVREIIDNGTIGSLVTAVESATSGGGSIVDGQLRILDVTDPDTNPQGGPVLSGDPLAFLSNTPGDDNDITTVAKGTVRVAEGGDYTIQVRSNDGFALRVVGQQFANVHGNGFVDPNDSSTIVRPFKTADANTRGVINLAAGDYEVELLAFESAGEAFYELTSAQGTHPDAATAQWIAIGDNTVIPEQEVELPSSIISLVSPAVVVNGPDANSIVDARNAALAALSDPNAPIGQANILAFDDHNPSSGCPQSAGNPFAVPWPLQETNPTQNFDNFSSGILGAILVDNGNGVPGETLELSIYMASDDRGQFHIMGESFLDSRGPAEVTLENVDGDMALTGDWNTCNTDAIGHIRIDEGEYTFEAFHAEEGGDSGYQVWVAEGFQESFSAANFELVSTPPDPILLPANAGLELVGLETVCPGDINGDEVVDAADLNILGINWQKSPATSAEGDLNSDGRIDAGDLNVLGLNWRNVCGPAAAHPPAASSVPEPAGLALLTLGGLALLFHRP